MPIGDHHEQQATTADGRVLSLTGNKLSSEKYHFSYRSSFREQPEISPKQGRDLVLLPIGIETSAGEQQLRTLVCTWLRVASILTVTATNLLRAGFAAVEGGQVAKPWWKQKSEAYLNEQIAFVYFKENIRRKAKRHRIL